MCSITFVMWAISFFRHFCQVANHFFTCVQSVFSITFAKWWTISFFDHFFVFSITFAMWFITLFAHFFNVFKHFCGSLFSITFFDQFFDHLCKEVNHFCKVVNNQFFWSFFSIRFFDHFCDVVYHLVRSLFQCVQALLWITFFDHFFRAIFKCGQSVLSISLFDHFFRSVFRSPLQRGQSLLSCVQSVFSITFAKWPITFCSHFLRCV